MDHQKPVLDYSSPADEQRRQRNAEDERREELESYNQATFGEGRPLGAALVRIAVFIAIASAMIWLLPRPADRIVASVLAVAFGIWEAAQRGWLPGAWVSLRYPWRRW